MSYWRNDQSIIHESDNAYTVADGVYLYEAVQKLGKYRNQSLPKTWEELSEQQQADFLYKFLKEVNVLQNLEGPTAAHNAIDLMLE